MIRDPSDGSVKEKPVVAKNATTEMAGESPVIDAGTSGLPMESQRAVYQEKLARSRTWLEEYHASRNPERVVREQGETGE